MNRAYYIQLYPNKEQAELLDKHFDCARWVYNKMIEINQKKYHRTGKGLSGYEMQSYLPRLKKQYPWLKEVNAQSLQIVCHNLADAYNRFFKKQNDYPKFKKKESRKSYTCVNGTALLDKHIKLPKLGLVKYRGGDCSIGYVKKFTISKEAAKYYVSILMETPKLTPMPQEPKNILGLDLGLKDMVVTSIGESFKAPKHTKEYQASLRAAQKALSRCKEESNRRKGAKLRVGRIHQKISNSRKDFNHKLSRILVNGAENQSFAVENLNVKGMMQNHCLAKSIADAGWYQFLIFLKYKAAAVGKPVLEVGRFFPSSKTCSACGIVKESLGLSEREWTCGSCGAKHHRDINAAINIALEAARNAAHGDDVIPDVLR
jgi:putative transposase